MEPRRGPGRPRNGAPVVVTAEPSAPAEAPKKLTATQELQKLEAMRQLNGGLLIPPPPNWRDTALIPPQGFGQDATPKPNKALQDVLDWLAKIAAIGSPGDVELAWHHWQPIRSGEAGGKLPMLHRLEELKAEAGKRYAALVEQAEIEAIPAKQVLELRRELERLEAQINTIRERELYPLEERANRIREQIAAARAKLQAQEAA